MQLMQQVRAASHQSVCAASASHTYIRRSRFFIFAFRSHHADAANATKPLTQISILRHNPIYRQTEQSRKQARQGRALSPRQARRGESLIVSSARQRQQQQPAGRPPHALTPSLSGAALQPSHEHLDPTHRPGWTFGRTEWR